MNKFTEEQVRDAVHAALFNLNYDRTAPLLDAIIAELTRPAVEFQEGEVIASQREGSELWEYYSANYSSQLTQRQQLFCRKLTTKEAGAQGLVGALEEMIIKLHPTHKGICEVGQKALTKWRQERGE